MARNIDETKIERIKEATVHMVVAKGFGGASMSEIAKKAGVAEGYLYRFYKSKADLVNDLLYANVNEVADKLELLLDQDHTIHEVFDELIRNIFGIAIFSPEKIKFMYVLLHDYNFNLQEIQRMRILSLCKRVKEIGFLTNEFRDGITEEEIYLMGVVYPIQFINIRFKSFFGKTEIGDKEMTDVVNMCLNSLKR